MHRRSVYKVGVMDRDCWVGFVFENQSNWVSSTIVVRNLNKLHKRATLWSLLQNYGTNTHIHTHAQHTYHQYQGTTSKRLDRICYKDDSEIVLNHIGGNLYNLVLFDIVLLPSSSQSIAKKIGSCQSWASAIYFLTLRSHDDSNS